MGKIIDIFFEIYEKEKKQDKAFEEYMKVVAPSSRTPFLENSETTAFLKWIQFYNKELSDVLSWYIYDANDFWKITLEDWKEYVINNKENLLIYINENLK